MIYGTYNDVRSIAQPGDVVVFVNTPLDPLSGSIELIEGGPQALLPRNGAVPSHVAAVRQTIAGRVQLFESTIRNGVNGCQSNYLDDRLAEYPHGCVYFLKLSIEKRRAFNYANFFSFVEGAIGRPYDVAGLFEEFAHLLTGVRLDEDWAMFCSAAVAGCEEAAGVLHGLIYAEVTPQDLVEQAIYKPDYYQILGPRRELRDFNTKRGNAV